MVHKTHNLSTSFTIEYDNSFNTLRRLDWNRISLNWNFLNQKKCQSTYRCDDHCKNE